MDTTILVFCLLEWFQNYMRWWGNMIFKTIKDIKYSSWSCSICLSETWNEFWSECWKTHRSWSNNWSSKIWSWKQTVSVIHNCFLVLVLGLGLCLGFGLVRHWMCMCLWIFLNIGLMLNFGLKINLSIGVLQIGLKIYDFKNKQFF